MEKYLAAYNDVEDDIEEGPEGILQESDKERPVDLQETKGKENLTEIKPSENGKSFVEKNDNDYEGFYEMNVDNEDDEHEEVKDVGDKDFVISDDDQDFFRLRKRSRDESNDDNQEESQLVLEAKIAKRSIASRLVSYGEDEDEDELVDQQEVGTEEQSKEDPVDVVAATHQEGKQAVYQDENEEESVQVVKLPPLVETRCSKAMQDKVAFLHKKVSQEGMDLNFSIQGKKNFRNPSIYEKLLEYCSIDEQGTNYPPHLYNPSIFGPESHYKALAEAQNENERKKKEKRKSQAGKKTSKWDNPAISNALNTAINNLNSAILNNTTNSNNSSSSNLNEDALVKKVPSVGNLIKTMNS